MRARARDLLSQPLDAQERELLASDSPIAVAGRAGADALGKTALEHIAAETHGPDASYLSIQYYFRGSFPEHAPNLPKDETATAVLIWQKNGKGRTTTALPPKWEHMAKLMLATGLGEVKPAVLETNWNEWKEPGQSATARRPSQAKKKLGTDPQANESVS